jgi:hypothetical protein
MSYTDTATLVATPAFQARILAASTEQALVFVNDARPEFTVVATAVILSAANAYPLVNLVAGEPGIVEASNDSEILSALQAVWPLYGTALLNEQAA